MSDTKAMQDRDALRGLAQLENVPLTAMAFRKQEWYGVWWNYERIDALVRAEDEQYATKEESK